MRVQGPFASEGERMPWWRLGWKTAGASSPGEHDFLQYLPQWYQTLFGRREQHPLQRIRLGGDFLTIFLLIHLIDRDHFR